MGELAIIAIMAVVPIGAWVAMEEGMALAWLGRILDKIPEPWRKPFRSCQRCMVSVWGTGTVLALDICPEWYTLPVYWILACGLQELIDR